MIRCLRTRFSESSREVSASRLRIRRDCVEFALLVVREAYAEICVPSYLAISRFCLTNRLFTATRSVSAAGLVCDYREIHTGFNGLHRCCRGFVQPRHVTDGLQDTVYMQVAVFAESCVKLPR